MSEGDIVVVSTDFGTKFIDYDTGMDSQRDGCGYTSCDAKTKAGDPDGPYEECSAVLTDDKHKELKKEAYNDVLCRIDDNFLRTQKEGIPTERMACMINRQHKRIPSDQRFASMVDRSCTEIPISDFGDYVNEDTANFSQLQGMIPKGPKEPKEFAKNILGLLSGRRDQDLANVANNEIKAVAIKLWKSYTGSENVPDSLYEESVIGRLWLLHVLGVKYSTKISIIAANDTLVVCHVGDKSSQWRAFVSCHGSSSNPIFACLAPCAMSLGPRSESELNKYAGCIGNTEATPTGAVFIRQEDKTPEGSLDHFSAGFTMLCYNEESFNANVQQVNNNNEEIAVKSVSKIRAVLDHLAVHNAQRGRVPKCITQKGPGSIQLESLTKMGPPVPGEVLGLSGFSNKNRTGICSSSGYKSPHIETSEIKCPQTFHMTRLNVHAVGPLGNMMKHPLFSLTYPSVEGDGSGIKVDQVILEDYHSMFVVATDRKRSKALLLQGSIGNQSLDDMHISSDIDSNEITSFVSGNISGNTIFLVAYKYGGKSHLGVWRRPTECGRGLCNMIFEQCSEQIFNNGTISDLSVKGIANMDRNLSLVFTIKSGSKTMYCYFQIKNGTGNFYRLRDDYKWEGLDQPEVTVVEDFFPEKDISRELYALEVDNQLFISSTRDTCGASSWYFYRPAMRNVTKTYNIKSLFYRYRHHYVPFTAQTSDERLAIIAVVDVGLHESARRTFQSGSYPGVYIKLAEIGDDLDGYTFTNSSEIVNMSGGIVYFNNGTFPVGLDKYRTKCQLISAFCCAAVVRVMGPGRLIRDFNMSDPEFEIDAGHDLMATMMALYGTLLSLSPKDWDLALDVLVPTRGNKDKFKEFLRKIEKDPMQ